ncbi:transmembrane protein 272 [Notechis scutatus]|uniref:Transmembrane protein 272 n=1 Tax=Notechis scutatus TaxID=8663 RepID=A0A6J1U6I1_9SAUR|nr:transmembrane protein 272 [Notechis scutatus]
MRLSFSRSLMPEDDNDKHPWWQNGHRVYLHFMLTISPFLWFISGRVFSFHLQNFILPFH